MSEATHLDTTVAAFGVAVQVTVRGDRAAEVVPRLQSLWELCPAPAHPEAHASVLVTWDSNAEVMATAHAASDVARPRLEDLLQLLTQRITLAAVDARAGQCVMMHAACLADPETGGAVAFVAPGGTGKTTLVRALGLGRWYVTDETTVVLDDGSVVPYPKPLSVRRAPDSLHKDETAPGSVGLRAPSGPVHLRGLCILDRNDAHTGPPVATTLATLDALVALVPQVSHLPRMRRPLQRVAALCESVGGVHVVAYRDAAGLAGLVDELMTGGAA